MFCVKCGNELPDGARFCNKCGASLPLNLNTTSIGLNNSERQGNNDTPNTGIEIIDKVFGQILLLVGKVKIDVIAMLGACMALAGVIASLLGQIDISTAWIQAIAAALLVYTYIVKKQSSQILLALVITIFAARFLILDIVHIFGHENYHYPIMTVLIHLITYAIVAIHWIYIARKLSYQITTVVLASLYIVEIIYSLVYVFIGFSRGFGLGMLYVGWCALMIASVLTYILQKEKIDIDIVATIKARLKL